MPIASLLNSLIKTIPKKPGVYKFYDQGHEIIYVGKANNLPIEYSGLVNGIRKVYETYLCQRNV